MADRLLGAERRVRPLEEGRPATPVGRGPDWHFNLEARLGCKLASYAAIGDRRHNRLLRLAAAGALSLPIDRERRPRPKGAAASSRAA